MPDPPPHQEKGPSTSQWEQVELEAWPAQEAGAPGPICGDLAAAQVRGHSPPRFWEAGSRSATVRSQAALSQAHQGARSS